MSLNVPEKKSYKPASVPFAYTNSFPMLLFYILKKNAPKLAESMNNKT